MRDRKFAKIKHELNTSFDILLRDMERGKVDPKLSKAFTRPAYYGTSASVGNTQRNNICEMCAYYDSKGGLKKRCTMDIYTREMFGEATLRQLPCVRRIKCSDQKKS